DRAGGPAVRRGAADLQDGPEPAALGDRRPTTDGQDDGGARVRARTRAEQSGRADLHLRSGWLAARPSAVAAGRGRSGPRARGAPAGRGGPGGRTARADRGWAGPAHRDWGGGAAAHPAGDQRAGTWPARGGHRAALEFPALTA